jgi:hypothetical protein
MKLPMVKRLVLKDLYIHRLSILGLAVAIPAVALCLALFGSQAWVHVGLILMSNSMIWVGLFLPIATILQEKKTFILSLPVSPVEYTAAKILVGLVVFLPLWITCATAMPAIVARHSQLAAGATAPIAVLFGAFLLSFLMTVAVALAWESTFVTTGVGLLIVVVAFAFMPLLQHVPRRILEHWAGDRVVWDPEVIAVLLAEALCAVGAVLAAFELMRRKRSYV